MAVNTDFFMNEAWRGIKRGGLMSLTALGIMYVSLVVLGIFMLILFNLNMLIESVGDKMDVMAYVNLNYSRAGALNLRAPILAVPGVISAEFVPKEEAWQSFKSGFVSLDLDKTVESNPLPDAYKVRTKYLGQVPQIANMLRAISGVEDVRYGGEIADRIHVFYTVVRVTGILIVALLTLATLMIVVNTIRLTVLARRSEISIMRLVGATNSFIRWPFILEGMILGMFASVGAVVSLKLCYTLFIHKLQQLLPFLPVSLEPLSINLVYLFIALCGVLVGMLGAMLSIDQSLKLTQT